MRAAFPNPDGLLLPGMYVRARLAQATAQNAILVPQQAVSRDPQGAATVYVVGPDDKAAAAHRHGRPARSATSGWSPPGSRAGDKVITEGLDKVKPDQPVRPVPAGSPAPPGGPGDPGGAAAAQRPSGR